MSIEDYLKIKHSMTTSQNVNHKSILFQSQYDSSKNNFNIINTITIHQNAIITISIIVFILLILLSGAIVYLIRVNDF